ncbi:hypothetical protein PHLCEN_2v4396 [Hermanssonia centrifuga]|uniref:Uncharacterized protein n=1 Tax=Hermanssonia centrifuga TaxID=98765 RepID=A0A2R6PNM2_9APHY|nr:hypothetical protein PHLCEN_2v4396 [Hermanssonia centrifuga]
MSEILPFLYQFTPANCVPCMNVLPPGTRLYGGWIDFGRLDQRDSDTGRYMIYRDKNTAGRHQFILEDPFHHLIREFCWEKALAVSIPFI